MNAVRVFFVGGLTSYRALFHWLNPWIALPMLVISPLFELLFFAYLGRTTHTQTDGYFVLGNAFLAAAVPALWGMGWSIGGERRSQTLGTLLSSPASRVALFAGRGLPAIGNGIVVAAFCGLMGGLLLGYHPPVRAAPELLAAVAASAFSCAALGLSAGALGLRGRNVTVLLNLVLAALLLFSGTNVPPARLPEWMQTVGSGLPLTHGLHAARDAANGAGFGAIGHLQLVELLIGSVYWLLGVTLLRVFELEGRRTASLELF